MSPGGAGLRPVEARPPTPLRDLDVPPRAVARRHEPQRRLGGEGGNDQQARDGHSVVVKDVGEGARVGVDAGHNSTPGFHPRPQRGDARARQHRHSQHRRAAAPAQIPRRPPCRRSEQRPPPTNAAAFSGPRCASGNTTAAAAGRVPSVVPARHAHAAVAAACATPDAEPNRVVMEVKAAVAAVRAKRRVKERESGTCVPGSVDAV